MIFKSNINYHSLFSGSVLIFRSVATYHKSTHAYLSGIYNVVLISFNSVQNNSNSYFYVAVYFSIQHKSSKGVNIVKKSSKNSCTKIKRFHRIPQFHVQITTIYRSNMAC